MGRAETILALILHLDLVKLSLQEDLPASENEMSAGKNSSGNMRYDGPCPPSGIHRYYFRLYALDVPSLNLKAGASRSDVEKAMQNHIIGAADTMGRYEKP